MMKKLNVILPAAVLLAAGVILLMVLLGQQGAPSGLETPEGDYIIITVDGEEQARIPLDGERTVTVDQGDGVVNVIGITEHGAVMLESSCENQLCVHMGEVTRDNWEIRPNQQFIICLPNRVTVELVVRE